MTLTDRDPDLISVMACRDPTSGGGWWYLTPSGIVRLPPKPDELLLSHQLRVQYIQCHEPYATSLGNIVARSSMYANEHIYGVTYTALVRPT